jgi:PPE-repeat protein
MVTLGAASASAAPILSVTPSKPNVNVGGTFSVDISIANINGPACDGILLVCEDLWGYQFDLLYNPLYFAVVPQSGSAIAEGPFLASGGGTTNFLPGIDELNGLNQPTGAIINTLNFLTGNDPGVLGSGVLATVMFRALAAGAGSSGMFALNNVFLQNFNLELLSYTATDGTVNINPIGAEVPEPSTMILLGSGLALAIRRRLAQPKANL